MIYYELSVTPALYNAFVAFENEDKQKIFVVDAFYPETEPGGRGYVLKLWFRHSSLPSGCRPELIENTLQCFKQCGDWDTQPLIDTFAAYLYWREQYELQHKQRKLMTIVGSVLLGMLTLVFVLYPLGLLSTWWLAVLVFPFIMEELQELTRHCLASSHCQKIEEALITEINLITEYADTLTEVSFQEQTNASITQSDEFVDVPTSLSITEETSKQMTTRATVHAVDSAEDDYLEHSATNDKEPAAEITNYGTITNRCRI